MKKIIILLLSTILTLPLLAQNNAIGAQDEFMNLLIQMGSEMRAPKNIGSWNMLQNMDVPIDNVLAYKFLWQENKYVKKEDANCNPIGFMLNKKTNVATLLFYKGKSDNLFYLIDIQTYNYKTGKLIDQALGVARFAEKDADCNLQINSFNEIEFWTLAGAAERKFKLKISDKGKITL